MLNRNIDVADCRTCVSGTMLEARKELCLGCGLCVQNCPQGAIYLLWGQAQIDPNKCNSCGFCLQVCPQGAITETIVITPQALRGEIQSMRKQTDDILGRISRLSSTGPRNQQRNGLM